MMKGAREFATLLRTGQYGRLYIVTGSHARGKTLRVYVLPEGEDAKPNGPNAPLNSDAVEVYGVTGGQPGWTESYGWLVKGRWCADFDEIVERRKAEVEAARVQETKSAAEKALEADTRRAALLATY